MSNLNSLKWLTKYNKFHRIMNALQVGRELKEHDKEYILACAILFIKFYEKDKRRTSYFEIAYFIVLLYSNRFNDFRPLLDLSINFGFYPITNFILNNKDRLFTPLQLGNISSQIERFKKDGLTQTLEQKNNVVRILSAREKNISYIAPTSFGKSSLFLDIIKKSEARRVAIIIPTKSLLTQTYKAINTKFPERKVLSHDEMFDNDPDFIATLTQERALRLLKNEQVSFDLLIIDEAHKIFEFSSRSLLLTRLIRRNRVRNPNSKNYYFSPLVADSKNLLIEDSELNESSIKFNIKEPFFYGFSSENKSYSYNRFTDSFIELESKDDYIEYIKDNRKNNNFIFIKSPRKIEMFSKDLAERILKVENDNLAKLAKTVAKNVHEDFYAVELIEKGIIYLHGKLPDLIKEYLESKFREYSELKFLVANTVILEGVNLPIDNLYVLNAYGLSSKDLVNLVGRVNRLNEVFSEEGGSLNKLLAPAHFIQCKYTDNRLDMFKALGRFKSQLSKDDIKNPLLTNFDLEKVKEQAANKGNSKQADEARRQLRTIEETREKELYLIDEENDDNQVRKAFLEANFDRNYYDAEQALSLLSERAEELFDDENWFSKHPIEKVFEFFILGQEHNIKDNVFRRLQNQKARNYYKAFVQNLHKLSLKEHINEVVRYFKAIQNEFTGRYFFVGFSYGEISKPDEEQNNYVDLSEKSHKDQVNLAMVKIKMESDFLSYTINDHVGLLKEINLVSEEEYNLFIYGTNKKRNTAYTKLGFSASLVRKLEKDNQLGNIEIDQLGHISITPKFKSYIDEQDDLMKFEITKYLPL